MSVWLRWWLFASLIVLGSVVLLISGVFHLVNQGDVTKISFLIYAIFLIMSARVGYNSWTFYRTGKQAWNTEFGWFISETLFKLGLIGTVIGLIYSTTINLAQVDPTNPATLQMVLGALSTGMSTAMLTTGAGLVCGLLLRLQLYNLDYETTPRG